MQRHFTLVGVQPHWTKSFKLSPDPFFVEKVRDIVGLYLNPPDHALSSVSMKRVDPSARTLAAQSPARVRLRRGHHARLHPARHHDVVRGARHQDRRDLRAMQAAALASGIPRFPPRAGRECPAGPRGASHPRQLRHAQTPGRARLACSPSPRSPPLHAHVCVVAQSSGALVCPHHATRNSARTFRKVRELIDRIDRFVKNRTTRPLGPSDGPRPPTATSTRSNDLRNESPGQHTRSADRIRPRAYKCEERSSCHARAALRSGRGAQYQPASTSRAPRAQDRRARYSLGGDPSSTYTCRRALQTDAINVSNEVHQHTHRVT